MGDQVEFEHANGSVVHELFRSITVNEVVNGAAVDGEKHPCSSRIGAGAGYTPEDQRSAEQREALGLATTLADELIDADALLFAVPLYNFGVSQHFKTWVDTVIPDPRFNPSVPSVLAGRPAVLVTVQGGNYSAGTPREGWDHATGWMRRILADVWSLDLEVVESAFTLVGVNPTLDEFTDLAATLRTEAEQLAEKYGQALDASR